MNVAVCFNQVPPILAKGEAADRISEEGAEVAARAVAKALTALGHRASLLPLGADLAAFAAAVQASRADVVFNLCEGFWGDSRREMHVAAFLELLEVTYTGCGPLCLGLTQDKARTKDILASHRLPTPPSILVKMGEHYPKLQHLTWPLIVKPRFEDASLGITAASIVDNEKALRQRIDYVHATYRQGALVEEFIEGREINAAVLGDGTFTVLPLSEIRFASGLARSIVCYPGKWLEDSAEFRKTAPVCPAPLKAKEAMLVKDVALRACKILECRDYARVDIRLRDGIPYILEVNANPDISPGAGLARVAEVAGITYPQLIDAILGMARKRKEAAGAKP